MTAKRYLIGPLAGVALAAAGCGSSNSTSATQAASPRSTSSTMPMTETSTSMSMTHSSTGMSMSGHGPMTEMMMMATRHAELTVGRSPHYGNVLYDSHHLVLYVFSADHGSTSTCYGACQTAWPPMLTRGAPRVTGLDAGLLGTTNRKNGALQVTYAGHPLYYWSGDTTHTIMCQHVKLHGGYWYVIDPKGTANTAKGVDTMSAMS